MEAIFGIIAFVVLFGAWVIIPSIVKKRHASAEKADDSVTLISPYGSNAYLSFALPSVGPARRRRSC